MQDGVVSDLIRWREGDRDRHPLRIYPRSTQNYQDSEIVDSVKKLIYYSHEGGMYRTAKTVSTYKGGRAGEVVGGDFKN